MILETVNMYEFLHLAAPAQAEGTLTVRATEMPSNIPPQRRRPAVLILPGGGYSHTSPREAEPVALHFMTRGYVTFVLEYSCTPHAFPVALREAAMAMCYIRRSADRFAVDPHMVAAIGFSAGGHLCGTLGTMYDCPEVADIAPAEQIRPDVLGLCYPVSVAWGRTHQSSFDNISGGDRALAARLSLDKLVRPDMPPVFLWHIRDDNIVPCRTSLILATALEEANTDFVFHVYRQGGHGVATADETVYPVRELPEMSWDVPGWMDSMLHFFADCGLKICDPEI